MNPSFQSLIICTIFIGERESSVFLIFEELIFKLFKLEVIMVYHCPKCHKELRKEEYDGKEKWLIGPIFAKLLRHLRCREHGYIDIDDLLPEERRIAIRNKWIGIIGGITCNIVIIILIILIYLRYPT